ncbi:MAG: M16 family metallopeptidase [Tenuifilaceae bacterium]
MLNRKNPPPRHIPDKIVISKAEEIFLPNGIRMLIINAGSEDVCRLELNFAAGSRYQEKPVVSRATLSMLTEGTAEFTSHQIAEKFDFYGSFCEQSSDRDFAKITLFSLNKYLNESLNLLEQVIKTPTFPEKELETFRIKGKQSLIVELEKVSTLVRQDFFKGIFGSKHPYGVFAEPEDYINLQKDNLILFHKKHISSGLCTIVLAGKVTKKEIDDVVNHFGMAEWGSQNVNLDSIQSTELLTKRKYFTKKDDAVQSAIRIGRKLINRKHKDYTGLVVLNTILGGYFGSRLMKNIREDKGYTYGISSSILPLKENCILVIGTEVGAEFTNPSLKEIYFEIKRLREEPVSENELDLVRNYLLGELLRSFDGAFSIADSITSLFEYNDLDYDFFDKTIHTIKTISAEQLMNLANSYLREDDLIECVAGSKSNLI